MQTKIDKLGDLDPVSLNCNTPGSFDMVAETMEDLAGLMDDIGLETLCQELDLELEDCTTFDHKIEDDLKNEDDLKKEDEIKSIT